MAGDLLSALLPQCLGQFGNEIGGHGRQPISLGPRAKTKIESGLVILLGRDTLFRNEPSAMTASSGERRPARSDLEKTQCGSSGLRLPFCIGTNFATLFMVAKLVQHRGVFDEDSLE